ncbi:MAG: outer membrane lipoprotein carrier protein LolA [Candidatus Cloacimonetes bacterium]|nr:outer membrane lipoprotein carrier protein LolA [Candidatus Cloacimonadota bacterium]
MKRISALILVSLILSVTLSALNTHDIHQQIDKRYGALKTWQADLTQTNFFRQLDRKITYQGKIYYRPERLLIDFDRPHRQRLTIAGTRVQLYDSQTNTVYKTAILPEFGKMNPVDILRHFWSSSTVSITKQDSKTVSVQLIPQNDPMIKQLNARIRRSDWIVEQLSYQDSGGNSVTYDFANIRINAAIPDGIWEFRLPKDVQVIEQ